MVSVAYFDVNVSMKFHHMFVHYTFSSILSETKSSQILKNVLSVFFLAIFVPY